MENSKQTGERIKELREAKKMTKEELGSLIGKDRIAIYRFETGQVKKIHYAILVKLANVLGTTAAYLNGDTDDPNQHLSDILETSGAYTVLHDLFQDKSNIPVDDLYSLNDREKEFVKHIIRSAGALNDEDYDTLDKMLDAYVELRNK